MMRRILFIMLSFLSIATASAEENGGLATPLNAIDGKIVRLSDYKGKVVLVNFWATWCPPCLDEIPDLIALQSHYADRGLVVVGINYMEQPDKERLAKFADEQGINYPVVFSDSATLRSLVTLLGGVYALPVTKVLNREGKVAAAHIGGLSLTQMKAMVEPLL